MHTREDCDRIVIGLGQTITLEGFQTLIHNALSIECSRLLEQSAEQACNMGRWEPKWSFFKILFAIHQALPVRP